MSHLWIAVDRTPRATATTYAGAALFPVADGLLTEAWMLGDLDDLRRHLG